MSDPDIVILGSGMAALGAAHHLRENGLSSRLFDKNAYPGGHTATYAHDDGFIFDDGPHISFTKDKRLQDLFAGNAGGAYETIQAYVNNYYKGRWIKHPAQTNLYNLPAELKLRCLLDFIGASGEDACAEPANYLEWLIGAFGETFARNFPAVYGKRYHTVEAERMSTVWIGPRLYRPSLEEVLRGALMPETPDVHYVSHFRYPAHGGFITYLKPFIEKSDLALGHRVIAIDPRERTVSFANGRRTGYGHLISSIPLPELVPMVAGAPDAVREAAAKLACTTCVIVNIGVGRNDFSPATWSYFYDEDLTFTRLSFPHRMSPGTCPPGCGSVQAECYFSDKYRPLARDPDSLVQPVIDDLVRVGLLRGPDEVIHASVILARYANVIFDLERETALPLVHEWLDAQGIVYAGRFGEWGYHWTDEAFRSGEDGARKVLARL